MFYHKNKTHTYTKHIPILYIQTYNAHTLYICYTCTYTTHTTYMLNTHYKVHTPHTHTTHTTHIAHTHTTYPHTYTYIHTHTHDCWNVLIEIVWDARQEWEPEGILSYWWDGIQVGMNLTHSGISSWESFNSVFKSFHWLVQPLKGYCGYMTTMVVWMRMALPWLMFECLVLS